MLFRSVAVGDEFFAQREDALFRADGAGAPFGAADGAEEDGVGGLGGGQGAGGQGFAVGVDGALDVDCELGGVQKGALLIGLGGMDVRHRGGALGS